MAVRNTSYAKVMSCMYLTVLLILSCVSQGSAYYCDHNLCGDDQYCCGDNLCCDYVYSLWYFWVGVVFLILVLSACGGFFRYCHDNRHFMILQNSNSSFYSSKGSLEETKNANVVIGSFESSSSYPESYFLSSGMHPHYQVPPPSYAEAVYQHPGHHHKENASSSGMGSTTNLLGHDACDGNKLSLPLW